MDPSVVLQTARVYETQGMIQDIQIQDIQGGLFTLFGGLVVRAPETEA